MTDTITPAVAHRVLDVLEQSPHIGPDGSLSALFIIRDAVKAWEAESARDEEAERYAEVYHEAGPSASKWAALHPQSRSTLVGRMRAVLDRLAADGRLLPESGELTEVVKTSLTTALDTVLSATGLSVPLPDSGPDGTPEKPWPTSRDVPDGVRYQGSTRYGDKSPVFVNRDGHRITEWQPGVEFANTHPDWAVERWAPFVRVDGDEA